MAATEPCAGRRKWERFQMPKKKRNLTVWFEKFANRITNWAGKPASFVMACLFVLGWLCSGPLFKFSDTWQLVINTSTTIITFLMVFLIQQAQNKDSHSIQLKLNELIASIHGASNRLINIEDLSGEEIDNLHRFYQELARLAKKDKTMMESHSVEEAHHWHAAKTSKKSISS
jgi:low affinity Fe/Cu permease